MTRLDRQQQWGPYMYEGVYSTQYFSNIFPGTPTDSKLSMQTGS